MIRLHSTRNVFALPFSAILDSASFHPHPHHNSRFTMPPRDYPNHFNDPRRSLPTPCTIQQLAPTYRSPFLAAHDDLAPPSQQRFTLPFAHTAAQYQATKPFIAAYPLRSSFSRPAEPRPADSHFDPRHSYRIGCRIPSSLSHECQLDAQDDTDGSSDQDESQQGISDQTHSPTAHSPDSTRVSLARTASFPSIAATMAAAGAIDMLPRMGNGNGMHSPFSIGHPLFSNDAGLPPPAPSPDPHSLPSRGHCHLQSTLQMPARTPLFSMHCPAHPVVCSLPPPRDRLQEPIRPAWI